MSRRVTSEQAEMFPDPDELAYVILEKVRGSNILGAEEIVFLEDRLRAARKFRDTDRKRLIACWRAEYKKAVGSDCPGLDETEIKKLQNCSERCTSVAKTCELIRAFFPYRASFFKTTTAPPALSPWGFEKHLLRLNGWATPASMRDRTVQRLTEDEARARKAPPSKEEVRAFVAGLAGEKKLPTPPRPKGILARAEAVNERRRELQAQAETLQETRP